MNVVLRNCDKKWNKIFATKNKKIENYFPEFSSESNSEEISSHVRKR